VADYTSKWCSDIFIICYIQELFVLRTSSLLGAELLKRLELGSAVLRQNDVAHLKIFCLSDQCQSSNYFSLFKVQGY
jgi:hypothetical protein